MLEWAGANVIKLETTPGENASFEAVKEAFDNNNDVKAFYCVWNETSTGTMINYLDKVKDLTSRNDSYYVVDGVSIVGGEELKVDKWGVDIAMTGAQKAFAAPPGISPIVVNQENKKIHDRKSSQNNVLSTYHAISNIMKNQSTHHLLPHCRYFTLTGKQ